MIRRRVIVVIALAMTMFSATATVLSGLQSSPAVFAGGDGFVVSASDAPTIFSSRVDVALAEMLSSLDNVTGVRPEVVAFSVWDGRSFVVRGMDLDGFVSRAAGYPDARFDLDEGAFGPNDALVGHRLLERLGVALPFTMPLTGSYSASVELVEVVGSFEAGTYIDDEMVVPLALARDLCGMPDDTASLIHVSTSEPGWLSGLLSPSTARFALFDVFCSKAVAAAGETVEVVAEVRNWGTSAGAAEVRFSEDGAVLASRAMYLNASQTATLSQPLTFDSLGVHTVDVSVTGGVAMRTSVNISVVEPYMTVLAPSRVLLGSSFDVKVLGYDGAPLAGALVEYSVSGEQGEAVTDLSGATTFAPSAAGTCALSATHPDFEDATASLAIVDLGTFPDAFLPSIASFAVSPSAMRESETATAMVVVENAGAQPGHFEVEIRVDSSVYAVLDISVGAAESVSRTVVLEGMSVGSHTVAAGPFSLTLDVEPWFADDPDLVELVIRYGGSGVLSSASAVPIYEAAKVSEGNIAVALFSVGAISALLSALAVSAVFAKEVREGRRRLGILRTIGASRSQIRRMVLPQSMAAALVGASVGVATGVPLALWTARSGALLVFGHVFELAIDPPLLATIIIGAVAIALASSLASAEIAARETVIESIRELEYEPPAPEPEDG